MLRRLAYFFAAVLLLGANVPTGATAKDMDFVFQEKDLRPNLDLFQWIYADGEITAGTADRFKAFIQAHSQLIADATVIFNSPGGSLVDGLQLGELISDHHFRTDVASSGPQGPQAMTRKLGICASACVFAYLGGRYRYLTTGSQVGIHRFRFTKEFNGDTAANVSQLMAGELVRFIGKMRVDPALFTLMTETSADDIKFLSREELTALKVITNDVYSEAWSFEINDNIPYLKADQVTTRGENKLLFVCQRTANGSLPFLMSMSELPERESIIRLAKELVLFIDHTAAYLPLGESPPKLANGRYVMWAFVLTPSMVAAVEKATTIGSGVSPSRGIFSGFEAVSVGDARPKLVKLLDGCGAKTPPPIPRASALNTGAMSSDIDITRRVAHNFDTQYKKSGSSGLQVSVSACYAAVAKNRKLGSLEYCYLLDRICSAMDVTVTTKLGIEQTPFWLATNVQSRANWSFAEIGQSPGAASQAMTRWQSLEPLIWSQLAALPRP